jgi:hypothetical protein
VAGYRSYWLSVGFCVNCVSYLLAVNDFIASIGILHCLQGLCFLGEGRKNAFGKSKIMKEKTTATVDPHQILICLFLH